MQPLFSVASGLQNCGNLVKYTYVRHKWKASAPVHWRKMRAARIFQPMLLFLLLSAL